MRDQVIASGAGMVARQERGAARTRTAQADVGAAAPEAPVDAVVISPDLDQWRLAALRREGAPIGGALKRAFDVVAASGAIVLFCPLLATIWLAVRIERGGDEAIFRQVRGGFGGAPFEIYKFRTMICAENGSAVKQVQAGDARITPLGRLLRRASLDELPQLFNVLKGDMSLIGPRPHATEHDRDFAAIDQAYPQRFVARPGITGLAQVSGCRGPTETADKVIARTALDIEYTRTWSFIGDLRIAFRTLTMFAKRDSGAI